MKKEMIKGGRWLIDKKGKKTLVEPPTQTKKQETKEVK